MAKKTHAVVMKLTRNTTVRKEYQVILNDKTLRGLVVQTRKRGQVTWATIGPPNAKGERENVPYYDPQWLAKKNGLSIKIPLDHPSMRQVAANTLQAEAA